MMIVMLPGKSFLHYFVQYLVPETLKFKERYNFNPATKIVSKQEM